MPCFHHFLLLLLLGSCTRKVDAIIRSGLSRFSDEVGRLWCRLADFYIRSGQFERARDVFEEAVASVTTVGAIHRVCVNVIY